MPSNVQDRLKQFVDYLGLNYLNFEKSCGIANGSAAKINEKSRESTFLRIGQAYPNLNLEWLIDGTGEMIRVVDIESGDKTENPLPSKQVLSMPQAMSSRVSLDFLKSLQNQVDYLRGQLDQANQRVDRLIEIVGKKDC